ncbi:MAG: TetR/AcrR family transcriptional regulator [Sporichthyaceae bacterium]|nr:TetR/AcrR family transcriptional regulator [Sporichthyaceae bacterium]
MESPARPGQPGGRIGRPRSETAERAIIEATLDVIAADGVGAVSIEGVAAKAGVGKTTIYRRWPNKEALICDAAASLKQPPPQLPGESVRDDLVLLARAMLANRMTERSGRVHACLMFEAHRHPELAKLYRETVIEPRRELVRNILRRGVKTGELRADLDVDLMLSLVTAPLLYRTSPIGQLDPEPAGDLAATIVDSVLGGLQPR